jgi:hypothetical protein
MRVYVSEHRSHTVYVSPARGPHGETLEGMSQWKTPDGEPQMQTVRFKDRVAEVDAHLGQWLIKHGYARRTRLIIPDMSLILA